MHVADEKEIEGSSAMQAQQIRKDTKHRLEELCARFQTAGIAARPHVYVGETVSEIDKAARECQATVERVWNKPLPKINVTYRNVTEV